MKQLLFIFNSLLLSAACLLAETPIADGSPEGHLFSRKRNQTSEVSPKESSPNNNEPATTPVPDASIPEPEALVGPKASFKAPEMLFEEEKAPTEINHAEASTAPEEKPLEQIHQDTFGSNRIDYLLRKARIAKQAFKHDYAERAYAEALGFKMSKERRKEILMEMAVFYAERKVYSKAATLYERFAEEFPQDHQLPQIYLELGKIYREIGAYDMAVSRFYKIINTSLSITPDQIPFYQKLTREAQLEIAETFFNNQQYKEASQYFLRLKRRELPPEEKEHIDFRLIYCKYNQDQLGTVLKDLHVFLDTYPESPLVPEIYFLLSHTYRRLNKSQEAIEHVKKLLSKSQTKNGKSQEVWAYWQRTTANQIANKFYEQKDFMNALKVYQSMASLDDTPGWQWPIIYQIGLCFEQLGMYPKAKDAYRLIVNEEEWKENKFNKTEHLSSIQEMASWRLKHLEWLNDSDTRLQKIIGPQSL